MTALLLSHSISKSAPPQILPAELQNTPLCIFHLECGNALLTHLFASTLAPLSLPPNNPRVPVRRQNNLSAPQLKCLTHPMKTNIHTKACKASLTCPKFPSTPQTLLTTLPVLTTHLALSSHVVFLAGPQACHRRFPFQAFDLAYPFTGPLRPLQTRGPCHLPYGIFIQEPSHP